MSHRINWCLGHPSASVFPSVWRSTFSSISVCYEHSRPALVKTCDHAYSLVIRSMSRLLRKASVPRVPKPRLLLPCQPEHEEVPRPLHWPACRLVSLPPPLLACQTRVLISGSVITSGSVFPSVLCCTSSSVLVCR